MSGCIKHKAQTHPDLQQAIEQRLCHWRAQMPLLPLEGPPPVLAAIGAQDALGWENFLQDRVTPLMSQCQQLHYDTLPNRKSAGQSWTSTLTTKLWEVMWEMWERHNHMKHSTMPAQQQRERANLLQHVNQEFNQGKFTLDKQDRHLLSNQEHIKTYSSQELEIWLEKVVDARAACARRAQSQVSTASPERHGPMAGGSKPGWCLSSKAPQTSPPIKVPFPASSCPQREGGQLLSSHTASSPGQWSTQWLPHQQPNRRGPPL